ncbi:glutathione S-transferase [Mycena latifolia]|nr:glutathione S-transferase [Mycena latifolia]
MAIKLYSFSRATCTARVATILHEIKFPFELEVNLPPVFLEKQPFGQIPYIDDDGLILYETRAICWYLAAKHPRDAKAYALFEQAACVVLNNFDPSASKYVGESVIKPMLSGAKPDEAVVNAQVAILDKKLDGYEAILSKQRYPAGDSLTLADLFHIPYAPLVTVSGSDIMTREPNVATFKWYNELATRPSWLAIKDGVKSTNAY